jgi:hypothetical protein
MTGQPLAHSCLSRARSQATHMHVRGQQGHDRLPRGGHVVAARFKH